MRRQTAARPPERVPWPARRVVDPPLDSSRVTLPACRTVQVLGHHDFRGGGHHQGRWHAPGTVALIASISPMPASEVTRATPVGPRATDPGRTQPADPDTDEDTCTEDFAVTVGVQPVARMTNLPPSRTFIATRSAATKVYGPSVDGRVRNASTPAEGLGHLTDLGLGQVVILHRADQFVFSACRRYEPIIDSHHRRQRRLGRGGAAQGARPGRNCPRVASETRCPRVRTLVSRSQWRYPLLRLVRSVERRPYSAPPTLSACADSNVLMKLPSIFRIRSGSPGQLVVQKVLRVDTCSGSILGYTADC